MHQAMNSGIGSILPSGLQTVFLESIFALGRAQLATPFLSRYNPLGSLRLERVEHILKEGQSLQLQFPSEDLGFRYEQGALVPEVEKEDNVLEEKPTGRRREYVSSSKPGSRLPHMQLRILSQNKFHLNKEICSTLDLFSGNVTEFLLIATPSKTCYIWADAAFKIAKVYKVPLKVCIIWPGGISASRLSKESMDAWHESEGSITQHLQSVLEGEDWRRENTEFVVDVEEISGSWLELCKMTKPGVLLVRPDEHIAWRSDPTFSGDTVLELNKVFSIVLRKPGLDTHQSLKTKLDVC